LECSVVEDPIFLAQNSREIDLAIRVPASLALPVNIRVDPRSIRRVLLEGTDLAFERTADAIHFTLPPQTTDRINSAEFQTHLNCRGLDLRFEHADPERRAGFYATDPSLPCSGKRQPTWSSHSGKQSSCSGSTPMWQTSR
jgi:hypothetical protein